MIGVFMERFVQPAWGKRDGSDDIFLFRGVDSDRTYDVAIKDFKGYESWQSVWATIQLAMQPCRCMYGKAVRYYCDDCHYFRWLSWYGSDPAKWHETIKGSAPQRLVA